MTEASAPLDEAPSGDSPGPAGDTSPLAPLSPAWTWIFRAAAIATFLPLGFAKHLPFCDLPEHVAVMATLRHWWDPAWRSQELFVLEGLGRTQYWLYHVVGALLAVPLGSAERANLFLLALTALGFPYALRELVVALRLDARLGLFGCLLFWNRALAEGLLNYVASIPVLLYALSVVVRQSTEPVGRRRRALTFRLAGLGLVVFYLHLSSFAFLVLGATLLTLSSSPLAPAETRAQRLLSLVWLAPSACAAGVFLATSSITHPAASQGAHAGIVRFVPKRFLLEQLPGWMHDVWTSPGDDVAAGIAWLALGVLVLRRAPRANASASDAASLRRQRAARGLFVLALAAYFLLPSQVGFAFLLDLRMAPLVGLFAVLLARPKDDRIARAAYGVLAAAAIASGTHAAWQLRAFEREEAAPFDEVLKNLPRGKKLLMLTFDPRSPRTHIPPFIHFGAYYRARYGGIASFSFSEIPYWPVRYRPEVAPPKKPVFFWDWTPCAFRNTVDGPYYDYVLVRGGLDPFATGPGPRWRLVGGAHAWRLYGRDPASAPRPGTDHGPCEAE